MLVLGVSLMKMYFLMQHADMLLDFLFEGHVLLDPVQEHLAVAPREL